MRRWLTQGSPRLPAASGLVHGSPRLSQGTPRPSPRPVTDLDFPQVEVIDLTEDQDEQDQDELCASVETSSPGISGDVRQIKRKTPSSESRLTAVSLQKRQRKQANRSPFADITNQQKQSNKSSDEEIETLIDRRTAFGVEMEYSAECGETVESQDMLLGASRVDAGFWSGIPVEYGGDGPSMDVRKIVAPAGLWLLLCQNEICASANGMHLARSCRKSNHTNCARLPCTKFATHGPDGELRYCRRCVETLKLSPEEFKNNAPGFVHECVNDNKCARPGNCQHKDHSSCPKRKCINPAIYGDDLKRQYCLGCVPKANRASSLPNNGRVCVVCRATGYDICVFGVPGGRGTHCKPCGVQVKEQLGLVNLRRKFGFCVFELPNGTGCAGIGEFLVNGEIRCHQHAQGGERIETCTIPKCSSKKASADYCSKHAKENKVKLAGDCDDCYAKGKFVAGNFECDDARLCGSCKNERLQKDPYFEFWVSGGYGCVECHETGATFGPVGGKPVYCRRCMKKLGITDMIAVYVAKCTYPACPLIATFGTELRKPLHCAKHRALKEENVYNRRCKNCRFMICSKSPPYAPYCRRCYYELHPNAADVNNCRVRELAFTTPLKEIYVDMVLNRTIIGGVSRRRPDAFVRCSTHSVIVEIDEGQHATYGSADEKKRLEDLLIDNKNKPIVVIRQNPDAYWSSNGRRIPGVFMMKESKLVRDESAFQSRLTVLKAEVAKAIDSQPSAKDITIVELFFDGYEPTKKQD